MNASPTSTPPALVNQIIPTGFIITVTCKSGSCSMTIWSNTLVQQSFFPFFGNQGKKDKPIVSEVFATSIVRPKEFKKIAKEKLGVDLTLVRYIPGSTSADYRVIQPSSGG